MMVSVKTTRERFTMQDGTKAMRVEVDGVIEVIPVLTVDEMKAACTIPRARMAAIIDESRAVELQLELDEP